MAIFPPSLHPLATSPRSLLSARATPGKSPSKQRKPAIAKASWFLSYEMRAVRVWCQTLPIDRHSSAKTAKL